MFECFWGLLWFCLVWFGFNDCRVGFGWADITAGCTVCLQSLLKRLVSCVKARAGQHQLPQQTDPGHWEADEPVQDSWVLKRLISVWFVVWSHHHTAPCALCRLRAQHGTDTELPLEQTSGQDHRRAGSHVTSLYFEGSYKYVYFLKALFCSKPLSDLRTLLSQMWGLLLKPLLKLGSRAGEQCPSHLQWVESNVGNSSSNPFSSPEGAGGVFAAKCYCCLCDRDLISPRQSAQRSSVVLTRSLFLFSVCLESSLGSRWLGWALQDEDGRSRTRGDFPLASRDLWCATKEDRRKIHKTSSCLALSQPRAACKLQATGEGTADEFTTATLPGFLH